MKGVMVKPPAPPPQGRHASDPKSDAREEAFARIRLRHARARAAYPHAPSLGKIARRVSRKAIRVKGSPLVRLRDQWPEIVGDEIAALCRPDKITGNKAGRTLTLIVLPAAAPLIQHQSEIIRQRVSVAAGGDITDLKLVQGQLHGLRRKKAPIQRQQLTTKQLADLDASVENIADPALREAIVALGRAVLPEED